MRATQPSKFYQMRASTCLLREVDSVKGRFGELELLGEDVDHVDDLKAAHAGVLGLVLVVLEEPLCVVGLASLLNQGPDLVELLAKKLELPERVKEP